MTLERNIFRGELLDFDALPSREQILRGLTLRAAKSGGLVPMTVIRFLQILMGIYVVLGVTLAVPLIIDIIASQPIRTSTGLLLVLTLPLAYLIPNLPKLVLRYQLALFGIAARRGVAAAAHFIPGSFEIELGESNMKITWEKGAEKKTMVRPWSTFTYAAQGDDFLMLSDLKKFSTPVFLKTNPAAQIAMSKRLEELGLGPFDMDVALGFKGFPPTFADVQSMPARNGKRK